VTTESTNNFSVIRKGYDPVAVNARIDQLTADRRTLQEEVRALRAKLEKSREESDALRKEVTLLQDTSPSPHAMPHRMAKMLRITVDEVAEMQAEARAEAEALIAATEAEAQATRKRQKELLAEIAKQRSTYDAERETTRKELDEELARMRTATESAIDEAWEDAQRKREELLAEARREADNQLDQARRTVDDAKQQRARILEQVMTVYRGLETVPEPVEAVRQESDNSSGPSAAAPSRGKADQS
jgi:cell division septum initiation protein DivIVA